MGKQALQEQLRFAELRIAMYRRAVDNEYNERRRIAAARAELDKREDLLDQTLRDVREHKLDKRAERDAAEARRAIEALERTPTAPTPRTPEEERRALLRRIAELDAYIEATE